MSRAPPLITRPQSLFEISCGNGAGRLSSRSWRFCSITREGAPPALTITRPILKILSLHEEPVATDKDSASSRAFGAFNGYGVSGQETGQVVYVNYGRPEDYVAIEKLGIDIKGKIVLARYGGLFRGLKVRNAQKRGAAGILIFSDPADDGFAKGDIYPSGRFRPGSAIQRGSVQFLSLGPEIRRHHLVRPSRERSGFLSTSTTDLE